MKRSKLEINKARVRKVLKRLRSVRCDNFRVIGAGQWNPKPRMRWLNREFPA
jgi:hypothetical protein